MLLHEAGDGTSYGGRRGVIAGDGAVVEQRTCRATVTDRRADVPVAAAYSAVTLSITIARYPGGQHGGHRRGCGHHRLLVIIIASGTLS